MSKVWVFNPTNKSTMVFWGHTPYTFPALTSTQVEEVIATHAVKHNDYSHLQIVDKPVGKYISGNTEVFVDPVIEDEKKEEKVSKPWDDETWDPAEEKDIDILRAYARESNLRISADISDDDLRNIVIEHFMDQFE